MGTIITGFLITYNIPPTSLPQPTIPHYLKLSALYATILGSLIILDLTATTNKLKINNPSQTFKFSNILGYFPTTIHRIIPYQNLLISQNLALLLLDSIWLEKSIPKMVAHAHTTTSKTITTQKGMIKLYSLSFLIPLTLTLLLII